MKIAVITGASSGMGREFAIQLSHEANFDEMWVIARRKEALESLKDQVCCPIRPIAMDLLNPDSFQRYADLLDMVQPWKSRFCQLRRLREIWTVRPDSFAGLHEYD